MMVPLDPSKKFNSQRRIAEGDTVVVYERHDVMRAVTVSAGGEFHNQFGVFRHADWVGCHFGSKVYSSGGVGGKGGRKAGGGFVHLLAPTPELWTLVLSHRTQILYIADISLVVAYLELVLGASCSSPARAAGRSSRRWPAPSRRTGACAPSISTTRGRPRQGKILRRMA